MSKTKKYRSLHIILFVVLLIIATAGCGVLWFSYHYRQILKDRIPRFVAAGTDSLYHITIRDIRVSYFRHDVTLTGISLMPDTLQAAQMRAQHRHIPVTLSTVAISSLDISGIVWKNLTGNHSFDCARMAISGLKWDMVATPHPEDSLFARDKKKTPFISRISAACFVVTDPNITYWYRGPKSTFHCFMKGGSATLDHWAYNYDEHIDTSVLLFAKSGIVRLDSFILLKPSGRYTVKKPLLDFSSGKDGVTLEHVAIMQMVNRDPATGAEKEVYDLKFPSIRIEGFNWNRLINDNTLVSSRITAGTPDIAIRYLRAAQTPGNKTGSYPQQLLLEVALHTDLKHVALHNAHLRYVEVTDKGHEGLIEFTDIDGTFENVTNIDSLIARQSDCIIKLKGRFMHKSPVSATFTLGLADKTGKFTIDGSLKDLDGDEVLEQTRAFTIVEVTSFHLSQMDFHEQGDETFVKGDYTVRYEDLKISLLKFKSNHRKGKKGPFSFLGSTLLLYPSNPMPDKDVRKVSVSFARDPQKGFMNMVWKNMYYASKKTAMRSDNLLELTDGKETGKGEQPKKGFFKRLFGKHR